jgi:hypothetical protein
LCRLLRKGIARAAHVQIRHRRRIKLLLNQLNQVRRYWLIEEIVEGFVEGLLSGFERFAGSSAAWSEGISHCNHSSSVTELRAARFGTVNRFYCVE